MADMSSRGDISDISELLELLQERYKVPSDIQLMGSLYFDRYPDYYFTESADRNLFRLLNISLHWGLDNNTEYYIDELNKLAETTTQIILKYRIYLHIAMYYSNLANRNPDHYIPLFRTYLDKADRIPLMERQKIDLYYYYAYYYYLKEDYRNALQYINRTLWDDRFIDGKLLQFMIFISIEQNYYFYRMEANKIADNIIKSPESSDMFILIIIRILAGEISNRPDNPFLHYFLSKFYERINDNDKALESALQFENRYKKPVFDFFIQDNKNRIRRLKRDAEAVID